MKLKKVKTTGVLLGGALACSLLPQGHIASAENVIEEPIGINFSCPYEGDVTSGTITFTNDNKNFKANISDSINISQPSNMNKIGDKYAAINLFANQYTSASYQTLLLINENVNVKVTDADKYALHTKGDSYSYDTNTTYNANAILKINTEDDKNKKVTITGNVLAEDNSAIYLNLNTDESYLSGKFEGSGKFTANDGSDYISTLDLHNGATWYVPSNVTELDMVSEKQTLNLNGGVLDFYHTAPNTSGSRTDNVTIKNYKGSTLAGTTFVVGSDISNTNNNNTTEIVLDTLTSVSGEEYKLKIEHDNALTNNGVLFSADNGKAIFKLNANNQSKVIAENYSNPGATIHTIKPVLAYKKSENTYYLVALIPNNIVSSINALDRIAPINIEYNSDYNYADRVRFGTDAAPDNNQADLSGKVNINVAANDNKDAIKFFATTNGSTSYNTNLNLTNDVTVEQNNANNYALHTKGQPLAYAILSVNPNKSKDNTIKVTGNVFAEENSAIHLYLNNGASYFAGEFDAKPSGLTNETSTFDLHENATWYVPSSVTTLDMNNANLKLNLSGGILDFAHTGPDKNMSDRSDDDDVNISNYTGNGGDTGLNNATFIIRGTTSTGENGTQIVFSDSILNKEETYKLLLAYAPDLTSQQILDALKNGQVVFDLTGLTNNHLATIIGGLYNQNADGGLTSMQLETNVVKENENYIIKLTPKYDSNDNVTTSDGPAMQMAKSAGVAAQAMLAAARADNNDLMRRMGDLRNNEGEAGAWVRYYSGESDVKLGNKTKVRYNAVQGGYDKRFDLKDGRLFAGIAISHTDSDFSFSEGAGDADTTLFGVYGSYVGNKGHFADMIFKYGRMGSDFATYSGGDHYSGSSSANMMSLAAEYGYRLKLKGNWYMEPQAELTYGYVGGDDYTMTMNGGTGAHVSADASKSLIGRLGITLGRKVDTSSVYAKLSLCHEFDGDMDLTATYGGTVKPYHESLKDTWVEYGLGFNTKVGPDVNLYGELEKSTGSAIENKWRANVGLRYAF